MNEPKTVAPAAMMAASTPSDMDVSGSSAVKVGHDVRPLLGLREPGAELLDPGRAVCTDQSGEDLAACLLGDLTADATLPPVGKNRRYLVAQVQRFEQFPLAAVEPRFIARRAHVQSIGDPAAQFVLRHHARALRARDGSS